MNKEKPKKCFNCRHSSYGFKIANKTHHTCLHKKHEKGLKSGKLSAWDTLMEFWETCNDFEYKNKKNEIQHNN